MKPQNTPNTRNRFHKEPFCVFRVFRGKKGLTTEHTEYTEKEF
jgi:hypothetical protein